MIKINYFDLGLYDATEIDLFIDLCEKNGFEYNIYGFEAHPEYSDKLVEKYKTNKNVTIINGAISNTDNKVKLYMASKNHGEGNSIFKTKNNVNINDFIEVDGIIFTEWLKNNIPGLNESNNIIRFNIEGAEWYLMNDLIDNKVLEHFKIFLGSTPDIPKVGELKHRLGTYNKLLHDNNIVIHRYVSVQPHLNCDLLSLINKKFK